MSQIPDPETPVGNPLVLVFKTNDPRTVAVSYHFIAGPVEYESDPSSDIDKNYFSDQESLTG